MSVRQLEPESKRVMSVVLMLFLFLESCFHAPVKKTDLPGIWVARKAAVMMLDESYSRKHPMPRLELKKDGTFIAIDMPKRLVTVAFEARNTLFEGSGNWKLAEYNGEQAVAVTFLKINGLETRTGSHLYIYATGDTHWLYFYFEDPDSGIGFEFEKESG